MVVLCVGRVLTAGLTADEADTCLPLKRDETLSIMAEGRELSTVRELETTLPSPEPLVRTVALVLTAFS